MDDFVYNITTRVTEYTDKFIFETIRPFCEEIVQMKIEKHQLEQALLKAQPRKITVVWGRDICPSCNLDITDLVKGMPECYCKRCGQHILRRF